MSLAPRWSVLVALSLLSVLVASPSHAVRRRAFVTSVTGTGDLSTWPAAAGQVGLAAGDAICRARAAVASLPNAATYRAWLSTSTTDAYCHVQGLGGKRDLNCGQPTPPTAGGPWYIYNGLGSFTGPLAALTSTEGTLYRPVAFDESGNPLAAATPGYYWTGTNPWGQGNATCGDWTSSGPGNGTVGSPQQTARGWSLAGNFECGGNRPLLCLEPGASEVPATWGWSPGAIVFVSSAQGNGNLSSWPLAHGQAGLAAGDEICRSLAAAAHLPSPAGFRAWLSDGVDDAADRIPLDTFFQRVDGYRVAASRAILLSGDLANSIHVDEAGRYLTDDAYVWTGTDSAGVGDPTYRCDDWQDGTSASYGVAGAGRHARSEWWTEQLGAFCNTPMRLYCFGDRIVLFWDGFDLTGDASRWSSAAP